MDTLNDDVLTIIISFLDTECHVNIGDYYVNDKDNEIHFQTLEVYLLNFVSKRFNTLIKNLEFDSKDMFNSYEYGFVVEEYFKQITRMNKPNLYGEFRGDAIPLKAFMGIINYACVHDYVDVVKYFHENKVKGESKNITVYFYFTKNIVKYFCDVSYDNESMKTYDYLHTISFCVKSDEDNIYETLINISSDKNVLGYAIDSIKKYFKYSKDMMGFFFKNEFKNYLN